MWMPRNPEAPVSMTTAMSQSLSPTREFRPGSTGWSLAAHPRPGEPQTPTNKRSTVRKVHTSAIAAVTAAAGAAK
jgi:hypothetical protein